MNSQKKIIYIDSESKYRIKVKNACQAGPFSCIPVRKGADGLESILREKPDVVVVEYGLEDMTGEELFVRFLMEARFRSLKGVPFIVLTKNGNVDRTKLYGLGFSACIQKPFHPKDLLEFIQDVLVSHQLKMEEITFWETIREAKDFLEKVVESSVDAIMTTDTKGIITYCNHACEEMFGYHFEELVGKSVSRFFENGYTELLRISAFLRRRNKVQNYRVVIIKKDGRSVTINLSIALMKNSSGSLMGALGISKEVDGENFIEYDTNESEKVAAVVETAVAVNHAINNPLVPILGNAQFLLQDDRVKDEDVRRRLRIIVKNALRIRDITQKLANISHPVTKEYLKGTRMLDIDGST
ncbi:MAG TPA: PAS domain S-box protein [bacterium]